MSEKQASYGVRRVQPHKCWPSPGCGIEAVVRLLVEPPVTVYWPSCVQILEVVSNRHPGRPPYGLIALSIKGGREWSDHYHSGGHAYHVIKNGFVIRIPSVYATFFARLIREGRAEYVWGPHQLLHWQPMLPRDVPYYSADARYGYKPANGYPELDVAP